MGLTGGFLGGGLLAGKAVKKAVTPSTPATPTPQDPLPMPDPLQVDRAREQSLIERMARRGRQSTILTRTGSDRLGS